MIIPYGPRVHVKQTVQAEKTEGGVVIPETVRKEKASGIVVAIGSGDRPDGFDELVPGDTVWYQGWAGTEIEVSQNEKIIVLDYPDIVTYERADGSNQPRNTGSDMLPVQEILPSAIV